MSQCKHAILVGSSEFPEADHQLNPLPSAVRDVNDLQAVFADETLSSFDEVQTALDLPHWEVMRRINEVMRKASREDQILVYYSGHGLLDTEANLYLATVNTEPDLFHATTIPVASLRSLFRETQCRRIVIILDCCFAASMGDRLQLERCLEDSFQDTAGGISQGYAMAVMAAAAADEQAFAPANGANSHMTGILVDSIRSGQADRNGDGIVTVQELFDHARDRMRAKGYTDPRLFNWGAVSSLTVSNSPQRFVWRKVTARIRERIDEVLPTLEQQGEGATFVKILRRANSILELSKQEVLRNHEALFSLLQEWSQGELSLEKLTNQWYQFDKTELVATDSTADTSGLAEHWDVIHQARLAILDRSTPAYVLDRNYHFLDWNPAFDELIAKQIGLIRFRHVEEFILQLENHRQVIERGQEIFSPKAFPLVDIEDLVYVSPKYGRIQFKKIAAQIPDNEGTILAWSVNLNIQHIEPAYEAALWADIERRLVEEVNWSIYAKLYDRMLNQFEGYQTLVHKMVAMLGDAKKVVDLGAGTGNVLVQMLRQQPDRTALAVEANEEMLEQLRNKFRHEYRAEAKRVRIFKGDIIESLREVDENKIDGVMLLNVLYAIDDRARCLREIYRVLKPEGVLVYSTPTQETDIDKLFNAIKQEFARKDQLQDMRPVIDLAYDRHINMKDKILRDSEQDVISYARKAGFRVDDCDILHKQYEGAVTIVRATKPRYIPLKDWGPIGKQKSDSPPAKPTEPLSPQDVSTNSNLQPAQLFISYAREDQAWCERILKYLQPAVKAGTLQIWADTHIEPGEDWEQVLTDELNQSSLALLLVTPNFLASDYISKKELPGLLTRRAAGKLDAIPVLLEPCLYKQYPYPYLTSDGTEKSILLSELQFAQAGDEGVAALDHAQQNVFIDKLAQKILRRISAERREDRTY